MHLHFFIRRHSFSESRLIQFATSGAEVPREEFEKVQRENADLKKRLENMEQVQQRMLEEMQRTNETLRRPSAPVVFGNGSILPHQMLTNPNLGVPGAVNVANTAGTNAGYAYVRARRNFGSERNAPAPSAQVQPRRRTRYVRDKGGFYEEWYDPQTGKPIEGSQSTLRTTESVQAEGWAREFARQRADAEAQARYIAAGHVLRGYNEGGRDPGVYQRMESARAVGENPSSIAPRSIHQANAAHAAYINEFNQRFAAAGVPPEFQSAARSPFELEDVRNFGGAGSPEGARRGVIRNSANYQVMLPPTSFPEPTRERQAAIRPRLEALKKETDEVAAQFLDSFAPFMPEGADPHKVKWMVDDGYREVEDGRVYQFKHNGEIWGIVVKREKDGTTQMQSDAMPYGIIQNILRPSDPTKALNSTQLEAYGFTPDEIRAWMQLQRSDLSKASVLMQPRNRALLEKYGFADQMSALMDTDMSLASKAEKITEIFKKTKFCKNDAKRAVLKQLFKNNRFSTAKIDDFVDDPDGHRLELEVV